MNRREFAGAVLAAVGLGGVVGWGLLKPSRLVIDNTYNTNKRTLVRKTAQEVFDDQYKNGYYTDFVLDKSTVRDDAYGNPFKLGG